MGDQTEGKPGSLIVATFHGMVQGILRLSHFLGSYSVRFWFCGQSCQPTPNFALATSVAFTDAILCGHRARQIASGSFLSTYTQSGFLPNPSP